MLDGVSLIGLTPAGLLLITVLMVLTGRLVPRATYLEKVKEADRWRQAYETSEAARAASEAQSRELLEGAKTTDMVVKAIFENSERIKSGDS